MFAISIIVISISLIIAGGYFVYVSAFLDIVLIFTLLICIYKNRKVMLSTDIYGYFIFSIVSMYFICSVWAIDSGMAIMGGVKFLPVFLFFLLIQQLESECVKKIISFIPIIISIITVITGVMMKTSLFSRYVTVNGGLAGTFQYPNTYAVTLLISIIIISFQIKEGKHDWINYLMLFICMCGIWLSQSRAVIGLMGIYACFFMFSYIRKNKSVYLFSLGVFFLLFIVAIIGVIYFFRNSTLSTLWGRLLYYYDAIKIILMHPFGMGYYGYFYVQGSAQTGVYSIVNVHNELLQLMLDIGIAPLVFGGVVLYKYYRESQNSLLGKTIILMSLLHAIIDYDYQFISSLLIIVLFINTERKRGIYIHGYGKVIASICGIFMILGIAKVGISDTFYICGEYQKAIDWYGGNTVAKEMILKNEDNFEEQVKMANEILSENIYVSAAYEVKEREAFSKGQFDNLIINGKKSFIYDAYNIELYEEYLILLSEYAKKYIKDGDKESAAFCLEYMKEVPEYIKELEQKTSFFAWKIRDLPQTSLSDSYKLLIEQIEELVVGK